jgi:hypothetical protein
MRRRPELERPKREIVRGARGPLPPQDMGEQISAFLASGGATFFLLAAGPPLFDPRPAGVQLCSSMYVPRGRTGFVKEIRIAPFMPPELADPWTTVGGVPPGPTWRTWNAVTDFEPRAAGTNGVWTTPFGWESYFDSGDVQAVPPHWTWQLRLIPGDIALQRRAFSLTDPTTWFLQPNVPVPQDVYAGGIPGNAPGQVWGAQRMQVSQGDKLNTHVLVPEDTTICLFAQWTQQLFTPRAVIPEGEGFTTAAAGPPIYPLLPSFGQLHGYVQAVDREAARENARYGWGG